MGSGQPGPHRGRDLDDRSEVAEFVIRFYRDIAQDERFHVWFHTIARVDWHAHTRLLTAFWAGVVLGDPHQSGDDVIAAHRWLHEAEPFDEALFDRWLEILDTTLDSGWTGPNTELVRRRGRGLAWAMCKRLTGRAERRPV